MTSLPVVGGDDDTWGSLLNAFLRASLNQDGSINTAAVQAAIQAAGSVSPQQIDLSGDGKAVIAYTTDGNGNPQITLFTTGTSPTSVTLDLNGFRPSPQGSPPIPLGTPANPWSAAAIRNFTLPTNGPDGTPLVTTAQMNAAIAAAITGTPTAPGAPTLALTSNGSNQVVLAITAPSNNGGNAVTGYTLSRGTSSGHETVLTTTIASNATSYTDSTAVNGTVYYYVIQAVNAYGTSAPSNEILGTPVAAATVPGAPTLVTAGASSGQVVLNWTLNASNGGATVTSQQILRSTTTGTETLLHTIADGTTLTYTDSTAVNGTQYFYEVTSVNSHGASAVSNELTATPSSGAMSPPSGYNASQILLEDQFNGTTLDSSKWIAQMGTSSQGPWDNNGKLASPYTGGNTPLSTDFALYNPSQAVVNNGLTLTAQRSGIPSQYSAMGYTWLSGVITTMGLLTLPTDGRRWYVQVNAKMPDTSAGMWPALWFFNGAEEFDGFEGGWLANATPNNWPPNTQGHSDLFANSGEQQVVWHMPGGANVSTGFHIYGFEFIPNVSVAAYVDGTQVYLVTNAQAGGIPAQPYNFIIQLQVAGAPTNGWHTTGGTTTQSMQVAEVQVYAR